LSEPSVVITPFAPAINAAQIEVVALRTSIMATVLPSKLAFPSGTGVKYNSIFILATYAKRPCKTVV